MTSPHIPSGHDETSKDQSLVFNEEAWTKATNILFVEQPTSFGFSWGPTPDTEANLSQDFYNFLQNFYTTFPEMRAKLLFLFGESYVGMYVPSIAHKTHTDNKQGGGDNMEKINLKGIAVGNGWMDVMVQGPMVIDYAYWHGMTDSTSRDGLHAAFQKCHKEGGKLDPPMHDFTTPDECNMVGATMEIAGAGVFTDMSPNVYDITTWDKYPVITDPNSTFVRFFNNPKVRKAINAQSITKTWEGCIPGAGRRRRLEEEELLPGQILLTHNKPESVVPYIAELLDVADIRVLIYNGDRDISLCAQGSEKLLDDMLWSGSKEWKTSAKRGLWMVDEKMAGYAKSFAKLDFVIVYNSGHLVPYNVPVPALDLITRFVSDDKCLDIELPTYRSKEKSSSPNPVAQYQSTGYHHAILLLTVAIVCFCRGMLASSWWRERERNGYDRFSNIEEVQFSR